MSNDIMCSVDGEERYLNVVLLDLVDFSKTVTVEIENKTFSLYPENAKGFCMDYGRDSYNQAVHSAGLSIEGFYKFIDYTGDVVTEINK